MGEEEEGGWGGDDPRALRTKSVSSPRIGRSNLAELCTTCRIEHVRRSGAVSVVVIHRSAHHDRTAVD